MKPVLSLLFVFLTLTACVGGSLYGPSSFNNPPLNGATMAQVIDAWGHPYSISRYGDAETWLYRRGYFVTTPYGNVIEHEYGSVSFYQGKVIGTSH